MPTTETGKSSTESEVSGLDYEETQLTLAPPGGSKSEPEKKRGFSESIDLRLGRPALEAHAKDPASGSSHGPVSGAGKSPASKAQVVGWPPVRSFRRNALRSCTYVKVAVDGTPYLRKVDLDAYAGYQQLLTALEEMLSCFTARDYTNERRLVDPVNGAEMFVASCKRLRLMKSSETVNLAPRTPQGCANARWNQDTTSIKDGMCT
ncbi:auxin-responsive protein [Musa troglodytarum]|uniref:Auxin-responsive protein n=1 Tax=Musa troglodytarum TaxID=320322 RepID=A0A9E7FGS3_9LILI|nr:auxin-responsive protein [Musa troglodytarum]